MKTSHERATTRLTGPILGIGALWLTGAAQATDVDVLVRHIDELWRGETSHATMSMTVTTRDYQRSMTLEAWSRGQEHALIVIRAPLKDRGIATLKADQHIWNYLPKINRVIKIPSSMMAGAWMGSHFTHDDLVRENTFSEDYTSTLSYEGVLQDKLIYQITAQPKPDAPVVWGKVVLNLEQRTLAPIDAQYFDENGTLMRTLTFDQVQQIGLRHVPMRLTLQPQDKPDEATVIIYRDIAFGMPLPVDFFSLQNLQQGR